MNPEMKKILFYSPDFNLCYSLQAFLQDKYHVTTSTDFSVLKSLAQNNNFDLLIIDSEPTPKVEELCNEIKNSSSHIKIVLTYVYSKNMNDAERRIRNSVSAIFYKPFDLSDISRTLKEIVTKSHHQTI